MGAEYWTEDGKVERELQNGSFKRREIYLQRFYSNIEKLWYRLFKFEVQLSELKKE